MSKISFINCEDTLNEIITSIDNKRPGIYLRFGDGDFNLAQNMDDMLAKSNISLSKEMLYSMSIRDDRVMICIPHHCKQLNTVEEDMKPGNHEYDFTSITGFLNILKFSNPCLPTKIYTNVALTHYSTKNPDIVIHLHKVIRKHKVIFIGNYKYKEDFLIKLFGKNLIRLFTNDNNSYQQRDRIMNEIDIIMKEHIEKNEYVVIIMAAGCASRAFSGIIYNKHFISRPNFYVFDYGSLLDYLFGFISRECYKINPPDREYILKNL
jgi:hypothetical protein